jgi:hypothetical protein
MTATYCLIHVRASAFLAHAPKKSAMENAECRRGLFLEFFGGGLKVDHFCYEVVQCQFYMAVEVQYPLLLCATVEGAAFADSPFGRLRVGGPLVRHGHRFLLHKYTNGIARRLSRRMITMREVQ